MSQPRRPRRGLRRQRPSPLGFEGGAAGSRSSALCERSIRDDGSKVRARRGSCAGVFLRRLTGPERPTGATSPGLRRSNGHAVHSSCICPGVLKAPSPPFAAQASRRRRSFDRSRCAWRGSGTRPRRADDVAPLRSRPPPLSSSPGLVPGVQSAADEGLAQAGVAVTQPPRPGCPEHVRARRKSQALPSVSPVFDAAQAATRNKATHPPSVIPDGGADP